MPHQKAQKPIDRLKTITSSRLFVTKGGKISPFPGAKRAREGLGLPLGHDLGEIKPRNSEFRRTEAQQPACLVASAGCSITLPPELSQLGGNEPFAFFVLRFSKNLPKPRHI
ncbi:hypothetical protein Bbelb_344870 [Branchiostoma belcheri]|nr:hypothetical protein Bbelb_344870 [Branchiostoma belcheri]